VKQFETVRGSGHAGGLALEGVPTAAAVTQARRRGSRCCSGTRVAGSSPTGGAERGAVTVSGTTDPLLAHPSCSGSSPLGPGVARPAVAGYVSGVTSWEQATSQAAAALALWDEFPVEASLRPLVLTGQTVLFTGGFPSDQAKLAFLQGAVSTTVPLPAGLLDALCPNRDPKLDDTLLVVGAEPTTGTFSTDRGPKQLPAWTVTLAGIHSPFTVLDTEVAAAAFRPATALPAGARAIYPAHLHTDGQTVTVSFINGRPEYVDYPRVEALETSTAAVVVTVGHDIGPPGPRHALGYRRHVTATLAEPLGARVLIDTTGQPTSVLAGT